MLVREGVLGFIRSLGLCLEGRWFQNFRGTSKLWLHKVVQSQSELLFALRLKQGLSSTSSSLREASGLRLTSSKAESHKHQVANLSPGILLIESQDHLNIALIDHHRLMGTKNACWPQRFNQTHLIRSMFGEISRGRGLTRSSTTVIIFRQGIMM